MNHRLAALTAALALVPAAPALAAPEPTTYLATQTARILPAGTTVVSFGAGVGIQPLNLGLGVTHAFGDRLEVLVNATKINNDARMPNLPGAPPSYGAGLGAKLRVGAWGGWDVAAVGHFLKIDAVIFDTQAYASVPFTRSWGGFELTLAPRVYLPDLRSTSITVGPFNAGSVGVQVGGRWQLAPWGAFLFEAGPGWHTSNIPGLAPRLGLRLSPGGGFHLDASAHADLFGIGQYPGNMEATNLLSATARYLW